MDSEDRKKLDAYSFLIGTEGWRLLEEFVKEIIDMEVDAIVRSKDAFEVAKAAGRVEALKRVMSLPKVAVSSYKQEEGLPVFDDEL